MLVDFPTADPIEIIKRLMIGSEGTLGFVSRATYNTVPECPTRYVAAVWLERHLLQTPQPGSLYIIEEAQP